MLTKIDGYRNRDINAAKILLQFRISAVMCGYERQMPKYLLSVIIAFKFCPKCLIYRILLTTTIPLRTNKTLLSRRYVPRPISSLKLMHDIPEIHHHLLNNLWSVYCVRDVDVWWECTVDGYVAEIFGCGKGFGDGGWRQGERGDKMSREAGGLERRKWYRERRNSGGSISRVFVGYCMRHRAKMSPGCVGRGSLT
jgi:hypothetical protein